VRAELTETALARQHRPLRVVMIGPYPKSPDRINGGVAAALMYLSGALAESGRVELIGVRIAKNDQDAVDSSAYPWRMVDLPLGSFSLTTFYRRQVDEFRHLVETEGPDVVHAHGVDVAGYVAVRCGKPAIVTVHGLLAECAKFQTSVAPRLRASLAAAVTERSTIRRSGTLIAISPFVTQYYSGLIAGKVHHVPNAIADRFFEVARKPEPGRFLYAGRIANGKGLVELLTAFAENRGPGWSLSLAGATPDPGYEAMLHALAHRLGIENHIRFTGLLTEPALIDEFARAQALVLPSHQETAPMVIQQAMAAGLPVIATGVGGIPYQLEHGRTGLLCIPGDSQALGALLRTTDQDARRILEMGRAARDEAARRFRASEVANATVGVYESSLASAEPLAERQGAAA
jgi:glycosyltransferase involved in cell wall biosynthesis